MMTADDIPWALAPPQSDPPPVDVDDLITSLILDIAQYRLLASEALHTLHRVQEDALKAQTRHQRTIEAYRELRTSVLRDAGVTR
jgi:hypothetical protein